MLAFLQVSCGRQGQAQPAVTSLASETVSGGEQESEAGQAYVSEFGQAQGSVEYEPMETSLSVYPLLAELDSRIHIEYLVESEGIYCIRSNGRYGYLSEDGNKITPVIYEAASPYSEGLACVCLDGEYGYLGKDGEPALAFIYDYATPFVEGLAYFVIGDTYGFMDRTGEPVFYLDCDSVSSFQEGLAWFSVDGKYGYIDKTGEIVIEPKYDDASYFKNGLAQVRIGGGFGVVDISGREVIPAVYEDVSFEAGLILVQKDGRVFCYGDGGNGEWELILDADYINPVLTESGTLLKFWEGELLGVADTSGRVLALDDCYEMTVQGAGDRIMIAKGSKEDWKDYYELLDSQGNVLIPFGLYSYMDISAGSNLLVVGKTSETGILYGCLDAVSLEERVPFTYDKIPVYAGGRFKVHLPEAGWGVIDAEGNEIYPAEYDYVEIFENGGTALWKEDRVSLCDGLGQTIYQTMNCLRIVWTGECYEVIFFREDNGYQYVSADSRRVSEHYEDVEVAAEGQEGLKVAYRADGSSVIVRTSEAKEDEETVSQAILKNVITPRLTGYYEVFLDHVHETAQMERELSTEFYPFLKLYGATDFPQPLLYYHNIRYNNKNFKDGTDIKRGTQNSGFYILKDGRAAEALSCVRFDYDTGDWAYLWYDTKEGSVLPGMVISNASTYDKILYGWKNGELYEERTFSYGYGYYDEGVLPEHPELYYSNYTKPYTAETFPVDGGYVTGYLVDGQQAAIEEYRQETGRYVMLSHLD